MRLALPQYNSKDYLVLAAVIVPYTLLLNSVILGSVYFEKYSTFSETSLITILTFIIYFVICGAVAVRLKKRFSEESQDTIRLTAMIIVFLLLSGLYLLILFNIFTKLSYLSAEGIDEAFIWAFIGQSIINIFITFLMEGIARFDKWKQKLDETHQLQHYYQQSQMQGLKNQVNPHFLFNSLNSLSSLISEDEDEAEKFLNEMSKVYRYMLRNDTDHLVPLKDELDFLNSYFHLLKARYGDSMQLTVELTDQVREMLLPPLTLQTIVENAYSLNAISKKDPLQISLFTEDEETLVIRNNVKAKMLIENLDFDAGLDLLVKKYQALGNRPLVIEDGTTERIIHIPLIPKKQEAK